MLNNLKEQPQLCEIHDTKARHAGTCPGISVSQHHREVLSIHAVLSPFLFLLRWYIFPSLPHSNAGLQMLGEEIYIE